MSKKVILISFYDEKRPFENMGLGVISSYAKIKSIDTQVINMPKNEIDYALVLRQNPCIIGIPIFDIDREVVVGFINEYSKRSPEKVNFVLGGIYASNNWKDMFSLSEFIDFIVVGEGEQTFVELTKAILQNKSYENIKGLAYRKIGEIIYNGSRDYIQLGDLPSPERDASFVNKAAIPYIFFQRGCSSNCSFCSINAYWRNVRSKTIKQLSAEVKQLYNLGYRHMDFLDPSLDCNSYEKMEEFAEELIKLNLGISYEAAFRANNVGKLSDELIIKLKQSGLVIAGMGIESFVNSDLEVYNKRTTAQQNIDAINKLRRHKISLDLTFMFFNPYTKFEDTYTNLEALKNLDMVYKFVPLFTYYRPQKGTVLFNKLAKNNMLIKRAFDDYKSKYYDSRVEKLIDIYNNHISPYFELDNIYYFMKAFFTAVFADFRYRYSIDKNKIANEIIDITENDIKNILDELGNMNATWYLLLLNSIKGDDNIEFIMDSIKNILTKEELIGYKNKVFGSMLKLFQKLEKEDVKYKEWRRITMKSLLYC